MFTGHLFRYRSIQFDLKVLSLLLISNASEQLFNPNFTSDNHWYNDANDKGRNN